MSGDDGCDISVYRLHELEQLPLDEIRSLYKKAVTELKDLKIEFEEFQCK